MNSKRLFLKTGNEMNGTDDIPSGFVGIGRDEVSV
jgi:hypothetical protein